MSEESKKRDFSGIAIPRETMLAIHESNGVGAKTMDAIALFVRTALNGVLADADKLCAAEWKDMGMRPAQAAAIAASLRPASREARRRRLEQAGIQYVTLPEKRYPRLLKEINDPPWLLYYRGKLELGSRDAVGIVGTRQATAYGRKMAGDLAAGIAERMTVVSGMARGIDTAAHQGALHRPCGTIAVTATPLNVCYPPENARLYREIGESGLLLSETAPGMIVRPGLFPMRNRIIAGLAHGVVVVEAGEKSGALLTADLALGYDREVFVVPGPVTSPKSHGAMLYYRDNKAKPVLHADDIFSSYSSLLSVSGNDGQLAPKRKDPLSGLSEEEKFIYTLLLDRPLSIDELAARSKMTLGHLHEVLISLLITKRINQQPGSVYTVL